MTHGRTRAKTSPERLEFFVVPVGHVVGGDFVRKVAAVCRLDKAEGMGKGIVRVKSRNRWDCEQRLGAIAIQCIPLVVAKVVAANVVLLVRVIAAVLGLVRIKLVVKNLGKGGGWVIACRIFCATGPLRIHRFAAPTYVFSPARRVPNLPS